MPTERPILFTGPNVRAILERRKSQTRRVVKPRRAGGVITGPSGEACGAIESWGGGGWKEKGRTRPGMEVISCPYGVPGDRLWVRETWRASSAHDALAPSQIPEGDGIEYLADDPLPYLLGKGRPSIFMPRWASRILLEVTDVRVQRVQEISFPDCRAEGMPENYVEHVEPCGRDCNGIHRGEKYAFMHVWDSINAKRGLGYGVNPWVWAISFKLLEAPNA